MKEILHPGRPQALIDGWNTYINYPRTTQPDYNHLIKLGNELAEEITRLEKIILELDDV